MDTVIVYLQADDHIQNDSKILHIEDLCEVFCADQNVQNFLSRISIKNLTENESGRVILSVLDLVGLLTQEAKRQFPQMRLQCVCMGAEQIIIERHMPDLEPVWFTWMKVGFASLIVFVGSAFTIMTYDQDVDVTGVFERIYQMVLGYIPSQPGILEISYAVGVAAGILLFFNPFAASRKRKEPSTIEIEMEKYESDIQDTIIKMDQRG